MTPPDVDAIRAATSDPDLPSEAAELYAGVLETYREMADASRRTIVGLLVVAGVSELLNRAAISGFQVGPLSVTDVSSIRKILPAVAAYLAYEITACSVQAMHSRRVLNAINETFRPGLHASRYDRLTYPRQSSFFGPLSWYESSTSLNKVISLLAAVIRIGSMVVPVLLLIRWLVILFDAFGFTDLLIVASGVVSIGFIILSVLVVIECVRGGLINGRSLFL